MKALLVIAFLLPTMLFAQQTYVPDDNFEIELCRIGLDNYPINDSVPTANISNVTNLFLYRTEIEDLTGIEDFINLDSLICASNKLTKFDISKNTQLTYLNCSRNSLTEIDVSNHSKLKYLNCSVNSIVELDISNNRELLELDCFNNSINSLDITNNSKLIFLNCGINSIDKIDVSNCHELVDFGCYANNIDKLDVKDNPKLVSLFCNSNKLVELDISRNGELETLQCAGNKLTLLNINNWNNCNMNGYQGNILGGMYALHNPDLLCIQVDNPSKSDRNTSWQKDDHAEYSYDCGYTDVPEEPSSSFSISPNPATEFINIETESLNNSIEIYDMLGIAVLKAVANEQIDVSGLPRGIYFIKIDENTYSKLILH